MIRKTFDTTNIERGTPVKGKKAICSWPKVLILFLLVSVASAQHHTVEGNHSNCHLGYEPKEEQAKISVFLNVGAYKHRNIPIHSTFAYKGTD